VLTSPSAAFHLRVIRVFLAAAAPAAPAPPPKPLPSPNILRGTVESAHMVMQVASGNVVFPMEVGAELLPFKRGDRIVMHYPSGANPLTTRPTRVTVEKQA
jgi:hypothetical protein